MKNYYVDLGNLFDPEALIIDEETLEAAERGENYLNPNHFIFHGEFKSMEDARQQHCNECWDARYAEKDHP